MGWLWRSTNADELPKSSQLSEEIPTDSAPAAPTHESSHNPPNNVSLSPNHDGPDAEIHSLLTSLGTTPKQNGTIPKPSSDPSSTPDSEPSSNSTPITPSAVYQTEMSCRAAFDSAFYCQSLGGQFNNVYRYGSLRDCKGQWGQFWFCVKSNRGFLGEEERESRIINHYKLRETKYRIGPSSEDVWKPRTRMVESAFDSDWEADLKNDKREVLQPESS
ncbi:MAG: hypothetical protein Q9170_007870 [Blastenia crenularia]